MPLQREAFSKAINSLIKYNTLIPVPTRSSLWRWRAVDHWDSDMQCVLIYVCSVVCNSCEFVQFSLIFMSLHSMKHSLLYSIAFHDLPNCLTIVNDSPSFSTHAIPSSCHTHIHFVGEQLIFKRNKRKCNCFSIDGSAVPYKF